MHPVFEDDASTPGRRIWRTAHWPAVGSGIATVVLGTLTAFLFAASSFMLAHVHFDSRAQQVLAGLFMLVLVVLMASLTALVWRDMRGKLGGSIALDESGMTLHLAGGRSLIHEAPSCREFVPYADVAAVETRLESYGAQGLANMQRAYRLTRHRGPPIFLFEERALATMLSNRPLQGIATEIAGRARVPLNDLGMVQGRGGILAAWFTAAPDWSASSVPESTQKRLWARAALTGSTVMLVFVMMWILSAVL